MSYSRSPSPCACDQAKEKKPLTINGKQFPDPTSEQSDKTTGKHERFSSKPKVLSRVFSEDYEQVPKKILDPRGSTIKKWNTIFLVACLVSVFVDPLFFFMPHVDANNLCIDKGLNLEIILTIIRSIADVFYIIQIYVRFHTAYVAPSSRVIGRGELVIDPSKIAKKYILGGLWIDIIAALPLPQILIWLIIPRLTGLTMASTKNVIKFIVVFFQYLPRVCLLIPQTSHILEVTGIITETAWAAAAYDLVLFIMAGHVYGAVYYLLTVQRQEACWRSICDTESPTCQDIFFDCGTINDSNRSAWFHVTNVTNQCGDPSNSNYLFGIYGSAVTVEATSVVFIQKYFYCLWFGLQNLCDLGQNLMTSTYVGENLYCIALSTTGLVLFTLLIANMQRYLQATTVRLEEYRIRRNDTEQWMRHRQLPPELRQAVRRYEQHKWVATRGVDEESLLKGLPFDLRREIKRHLCYDLIRNVPLFDQMDERMLDAICERLKPALCTQGTCPVREGDPVNEMMFIIRGNLDSYTTNGGRAGFFNSCRIGPGDFFGEELLTWALEPRPSIILPTSTRTVKAISEVEAFALMPEDLKFVASQFRRLHSKKLKHKFRFYSHQWRTWAACFIQAAWRRYKRRKNDSEVKARLSVSGTDVASSESGLGGSTRTMEDIIAAWRSSSASLRKPAEPDFSIDGEL